MNELVASIVARPGPYKAGRLALRSRLVSEARRAFRSSGRLGADETWFEGELTLAEEFTALLDTLWPTVSPTALVRDLLSSRGQLERTRPGCSRASGVAAAPARPRRHRSATAWSPDDLALLDEATFLTGGRTRSYGHIVVDEAQDLTPMQFRMIARRAPSDRSPCSVTSPRPRGLTYADWDEVRAHLPTGPHHHDELTLGYRAPGRVLDFASRLLPVAAPGVDPPRRSGPASDPADAARSARRAASRSAGRGPALTEDACAGGRDGARGPGARVTRLARRDDEVGLLERDAMTRPITIVPALRQGPGVRRRGRRRARRDRRR